MNLIPSSEPELRTIGIEKTRITYIDGARVRYYGVKINKCWLDE